MELEEAGLQGGLNSKGAEEWPHLKRKERLFIGVFPIVYRVLLERFEGNDIYELQNFRDLDSCE